MASTINAQTTPFAAVVTTADDTGNLAFQTANVTAITIDSSQNTGLVGNLNFSGTGKRITGDFSNATVANRVSFQNSTANSPTTVYAIPNGTSATSAFIANSDSSSANGSEIRLIVDGTTTRITSSSRGTGTVLPLAFDVGSERMRIDTSGNVGIGTSSPTNYAGYVTLALNDTTGSFVELRANGSSNGELVSDSNGLYIKTIPSVPMTFGTNNTERMRIDSSGNVGIGTSSPAGKLDVTTSVDTKVVIKSAAGTYTAGLDIAGNNATINSNNVILYQGGSSEAYLWNRANTFFSFGTNNAERMRISAAGGLSIGTTADPGAGAIFATGNITAYYSDDRLKTKLGGIENALDKVKALSGFYYEANQTAQDLGYQAVREVGVSAQQVQAVMPEVVKPAPIDQQYLTVDYERLVPLLIEAIKELEEKVAKLENK